MSILLDSAGECDMQMSFGPHFDVKHTRFAKQYCCYVKSYYRKSFSLFDEQRSRHGVAICEVIRYCVEWNVEHYCDCRGGATVLKVGGQILPAKPAENFLLTPTFWPVGGQNIA